MSIPQQTVQSCHAVIEATKAFGYEKLVKHPSVIILSVEDETALHKARLSLVNNKIQHVHFYEPDIGNELTAIATKAVWGDDRKIFRKYKLMKTYQG